MSQTQTSTKPRRFKKLNKVLPTKTSKKGKTTSVIFVKERIPEKTEKKKRPQFPKISRFIPELPHVSQLQTRKVPPKWGILLGLLLVTLLWNFFVIRDFLSVGKSWMSLLSKRQKISQEMGLWENIVREYPNYRDAYFESALLAYRLGDITKEESFLQKLALIDPNFPLSSALEKLGKLQNIE